MHICVCVWRQGVGKHECNVCGDQHRGRDPLALELQSSVSSQMQGLWTKLNSSSLQERQLNS